ncbi:hypothetical protein S7335_4214 [Synechococcus sp. PCC 7335]|nr:hypothetical protein S7335_4214 [Synechococcus sp. PCC 7335]
MPLCALETPIFDSDDFSPEHFSRDQPSHHFSLSACVLWLDLNKTRYLDYCLS